MKKPTKVTVMGIPFEVKHPQNVDKEKSYGETVGTERVIKVKQSLEGDIFEATLLHEIIHGIFYVSGQTELMSEEQEEALTVALEHGILSLYTRKDWDDN